MLEPADSRGLGRASDAIARLPHGRVFKVADGDKFAEAVAPMFFELTKIRSLQRQFNLWGFER